MSLDINIDVDEELSALLRGSLSAATERRVIAWAREQLRKKKAGLPYERLPGFYSPSPPVNNSSNDKPADFWVPPVPAKEKEKRKPEEKLLPFFMVVNSNRVTDDNFTLQIDGQNLGGIMNFSADGQRTSYAYIPPGQTESSLKSSPAFRAIETLESGLFLAGTYSLGNFQPAPGIIVVARLINVGLNDRGNQGSVYSGYLNSTSVASSTWIGTDGDSFVSSEFAWGVPGQRFIYE